MTPTFQMSADARLIYQLLAKADVGETVNHSAIEAEVSRPLVSIRGAIGTALRRCLRDKGMVFSNVRGVGYLRCGDAEIVDASVSDTERLRKGARRAVEKLTKVSAFDAMPPAKQLEHTTRMSVLNAIATVTRESSINKVRSIAQGRSSELPLAETVRAFLT